MTSPGANSRPASAGDAPAEVEGGGITITSSQPLADATIKDAADAGEAAYFHRWLGPILSSYPQLTVKDYWRLTVTEHASLVSWLIEAGVLGRADAN